jgi:hypothetical protein
MSIWSTVEAEAWAYGLRYEDYLNLHNRNNTNALTEKSYRFICEAFDADLEREPKRAKI